MDRIEETYETLRIVVPLMVEHHVPATAENYFIWYKYVSGEDDALRQAVEKMIGAKEEFTDDRNEALFNQFCKRYDQAELERIREDLKAVLNSLFKQTQELTGQAEQYDAYVTKSLAGLTETSPVQEIRNVVDQIAVRTRTLATFGRAVRHRMETALETLNAAKKDLEQVKVEASYDFLTGVLNRRSFLERLTACCTESHHRKRDLCLLFVDVDHFKKFNDEFGHLLGDEVLKFVANTINETVRQTDTVARFGGEEFAIILPGASFEAAKNAAERIRSRFASAPLKTSRTSRNLGMITVSIGVARHRPGEQVEDFVNRADQALYLAKSNGRNCVAAEPEGTAAEGQPVPPGRQHPPTENSGNTE